MQDDCGRSAISSQEFSISKPTSISESRSRRQKGSFHDRLGNHLYWEIVGIIFSIACSIAIVAVFFTANDKPLPKLASGIMLSVIISTLAIASKVALLFTLCNCLGQLKWLWVVAEKPQTLNDVELYDKAGRGPLTVIPGPCTPRTNARKKNRPFLQLRKRHLPQFPTNETDANLRRNLDLATYNLAPTGNSTLDQHIFTAFGLDTPSPEVGTQVFHFDGQGKWNLHNYYMWIAWGYDTEGYGYFVQYEIPVEEGGDGDIAIVSRKKGGPSSETTQAIFCALNVTFTGEERGNLSSYANGLLPLKLDDRRDGEGLTACDEACVQNLWMAAATYKLARLYHY